MVRCKLIGFPPTESPALKWSGGEEGMMGKRGDGKGVVDDGAGDAVWGGGWGGGVMVMLTVGSERGRRQMPAGMLWVKREGLRRGWVGWGGGRERLTSD